MDYIELKSGKMVKYDYRLSYHGIHAETLPIQGLTKAERIEFTNKLRNERDVVHITFREDKTSHTSKPKQSKGINI